MLERIKLLLNKMDIDLPQITEDMTEEEKAKIKRQQDMILADKEKLEKLLRTLILLCQDEATAYCNLEEYDEALDYIIVQMVIERYNRIGSEGTVYQSGSGAKVSYDSFYSEKVRKLLNKHRRIKTI